jgi:hypothetical protein
VVQETRVSPECPSIPPAAEIPLPASEIRKQISLFVPLSDYRALRLAAAKRHLPMAELIRRWIDPELKKLRRAGFAEHPINLTPREDHA